MWEKVKQRIFAPFLSTKKTNGSGCGLSVALTLIKGHRGNIEVRSKPGRGTTMIIKLPVSSGKSVFAAPPSLNQKQAIGRIVALDVIGIANFLQKLLECHLVLGWYLDTDQDAPDVRTVIAVVKQTDVPAVRHVL